MKKQTPFYGACKAGYALLDTIGPVANLATW